MSITQSAIVRKVKPHGRMGIKCFATVFLLKEEKLVCINTSLDVGVGDTVEVVQTFNNGGPRCVKRIVEKFGAPKKGKLTYRMGTDGQPVSSRTRSAKLQIQIPQEDGIPLSIKLYWNKSNSCDACPEVGTEIWVANSDPSDFRRYKTIGYEGKIENKVERGYNDMCCKNDDDSDKHVRINIRQTHTSQDSYQLSELFHRVCTHMMSGQGGYFVIMRQDQFARFIIIRNQMGMQNLIKDLRPKMVDKGVDPYALVSAKTGVVPTKVKAVLDYMGCSKRRAIKALEDEGKIHNCGNDVHDITEYR